MVRLLFLYFLSFSTLLFSSCQQKAKEPDIEKALENILLKFPILSQRQNNQGNSYKLIRSVLIGDKGIELKLFSLPDNLNDAQEIVIIINKDKELYAIPFFSNTYKDYWDFQFDSALKSIPKANTTFEKELKDCLMQLNLNDTLGTANNVMSEMFTSLLQCEQVRETDSTYLNAIAMVNNYNLPTEATDSCLKRVHKNWKAIRKAFYPEKNITNYNAFWDKRNSRVYQFDLKNFGYKKKMEFEIRNYRFDCIYQLMNL